MKDTYIIIPVYNEGKVIASVIEDAKKTFLNIVAVDDGSSDNSATEISRAGAQLVKHPVNQGQGAALQTGLDWALLDKNAQYFVTFDADGQHRVSDVLAMLDVIKKEDLDIVLGSRFLGTVNNMPRSKRMLLKIAVKFSNITSGLKLTDTHNGLRVFNRKVAEQLQLTMADFSHASEILERIVEKKFKYKEVPVTIAYTDYSKGKGQSMINAVNIGFDTLLRKVLK